MRRLGILAAALVLGASCGPGPLLETVQKDVSAWEQTVGMPSIVPAGGTYRGSAPAISLTVPTAGTVLFYSTNGQAPAFNTAGGFNYTDTSRSDAGIMTWAAGAFSSGKGLFPLQAAALRSDGRRSSVASARFRVIDTGDTWWVQPSGETPARWAAVHRTVPGTNVAVGSYAVSAGRQVGLVSVFDDSGTRTWTRTIAGASLTSQAQVTAVTSDSIGDLFVVGTLTPSGAGDTYSFGDGQTLSVTSPSGFLAKFSSAQVCLWAVALSESTHSASVGVYPTGVADLSGKVYVCGYVDSLSGSVEYGDAVTPGSPQVWSLQTVATAVGGDQSNPFLVSYDASLGSPSSISIPTILPGPMRWNAVAAYVSTIAVAGAFLSPAAGGTFNLGTGVPLGGVLSHWNAAVLTLNSSLSPVNFRAIDSSGAGDSQFTAVALSSTLVVAGGWNIGDDTRDWGSGQTWSGPSTGKNAVVVGYDTAAATVWTSGIVQPVVVGAGTDSTVAALWRATDGTFLAAGQVGSGETWWFPTAAATGITVVTSTASTTAWTTQLSPSDGKAYFLAIPSTGSVTAAGVAEGASSSLWAAGSVPAGQALDWGYGLSTASSSGERPLLWSVYR